MVKLTKDEIASLTVSLELIIDTARHEWDADEAKVLTLAVQIISNLAYHQTNKIID